MRPKGIGREPDDVLVSVSAMVTSSCLVEVEVEVDDIADKREDSEDNGPVPLIDDVPAADGGNRVAVWVSSCA